MKWLWWTWLILQWGGAKIFGNTWIKISKLKVTLRQGLKKKETNLNSIYYQRWAIFSQEDITFCLCVCVFRTRRQRAASVRPGCDRCVEVGGVGAETGTADTGQPQQGEASRLRHRLPLASRFHLDWKIICASPTFVCCHYFLRLLSRLQSCLLLFDV